MGLDMYLFGKHSKHPDREFYWRKANAIHAWFVENVQGGIDNCDDCPVTRDQLKTLLKKVKQVLKTPEKAPDILPTKSGFFFGTYEYDEGYFEGLKMTKEHLTQALKLPEDWTFIYTSSW